MKKIVIAGASGFIGKELINFFLTHTNYEITALSRTIKKSTNSKLKWLECDLFSLLDIEKGIEGADILIYLVHSMQPSARLDQASFDDYDLILADNFGRAAKKKKISKVIYLGGLIQEGDDLSRHLKSRLEVEEVLKESIPDYTILRAGLILGHGGSSYHILLNLIERLPLLICPAWTLKLTSPILVDQVVNTIYEIIRSDNFKGKTYDLASNNMVSYLDMLKQVAKDLSKKRVFIKFPLNLILLSRLWVSLITGASRTLVYPLVESLKHNLIARKDHLYHSENVKTYSVEEAISLSVSQSQKQKKYVFKTLKVKRNTVRSVQRSIIPHQMSARDLALEYMNWLPRFLSPFIRVEIDSECITFSFLNPKIKLLILNWSPQRSTEDRQLFYIKGGLLAAKQDRGRLEFREVLNSKYALFAIHDFSPSLPWYIYRYTQALVHLFVMNGFKKYLMKKNAINKHR